jgi:hypothetical protein
MSGLAVARCSVVLYCGLHSLREGGRRVSPPRLFYSDIGWKLSTLSHIDTLVQQYCGRGRQGVGVSGSGGHVAGAMTFTNENEVDGGQSV